MKHFFEIDKKVLADALRRLSPVFRASKRAKLPVLNSIFVVCDADGVSLTACDLEVLVEIKLKAEAFAHDSFLIDFKLCQKMLSSMSGVIVFYYDNKSSKVKMTDGAVRYLFPPSRSVIDYPAMENENYTGQFTQSASWFEKFKAAANCRDLHDSRRAILGIQLKNPCGKSKMFSSNGRALAVFYSELVAGELEFDVFIPDFAVVAALSAFRWIGEDFSFSAGTNIVRISAGNVSLFFKMYKDIYPNCESVIRDEMKQSFKVSSAALKDALRPHEFTSKRWVEVSHGGKILLLKSSSDDFGVIETALEINEIATEKKITFSVDASLWIKAAQLSSEWVVDFRGKNEMIVMRGDGVDFYFMPLRIN